QPTEGAGAEARLGTHAAPPAVVSAGLTVPTVDGRRVEYANFDHGASTPALVSVKKAVDTATATYSSVHRGKGFASQVTSAWYEAARAEVATFVGAREDDHVVFTRNTTDSFNLLARCLPRDTVVFVFATEHHATLLPWNGVRTVRLEVPGSHDDAEVLLDEALTRHPGAHRLVVVTGASNVTGELWPLDRLTAGARRHGARVALDAAQLAPHLPVDLAGRDVDYVAFSGHKLYAPYGAGVLAGRADWLDAAQPYLAGGGATAAVTADGTVWHTGPARHEAGSPNVLGAIALAAACAAFRSNRVALEAHEERIGRRLLDGLRAIEGVRTHSIFGDDSDRVAVATFTVDGLPSGLVSAALSAEHGIGVRDGKFCAHLLVDALLEHDADATAVRVSAGLATTDEHVERLLAAVASIAAEGPQAEYEDVPGQGWTPVADPREVTPPLPW
ncbi:aminotransferase class V-fold PLP-dependent enzyme, partial [Nostocoides japonicum]|uniref:aminotransferase class V-fold PLP-dependent enzyme n=1 Tax=Nostocoides japonicum TaxID=99481 RepID=UPI0009FB5B12